MGKRKGDFVNYNRSYKKSKRDALDVGMRGFLCTCNAHERECVREAYNILGCYGEKLYGEEELISKDLVTNEEEVSNDDEEKEIEEELKKEVESLKQGNKNSKERRFQVVDSGANNCIFIKTTVPDPVALVYNITSDIARTNQKKSRYLIRMIPVEVTCKAYLDDIKRECEKLFEKHFKCDPTTYSIVFNKRYNDKVLRTEIIESLARLIQDRNILHKVDLKQAKKTVSIEIIKNKCCISVVSDYFKLKKYNLLELSKRVEDNHTEKSVIEKATDKSINNDENKGNEIPKTDEKCKGNLENEPCINQTDEKDNKNVKLIDEESKNDNVEGKGDT